MVDYEGADYAFEVVADDLEYADTSTPAATVPDAILEALETRRYIAHRE